MGTDFNIFRPVLVSSKIICLQLTPLVCICS